MSDKEKNPVTPEENTQPAAAEESGGEKEESIVKKAKKLFTVQSPYADYAADNDKVSEMMEESEGEEPVQPTAKGLLQTVLAAIGLVGMFIGIALMFSIAGTCMGMK